MRPETARALIALNNRFYEQNAATFSATRQAPWHGWADVLRIARGHGVDIGGPCHVLDLAAGNLRFERFLVEEGGGAQLAVTAIDSCPSLADGPAAAARGVRRVRLDVLDTLLGGRTLPAIEPADLAVCFGFMHHVPTTALRERVAGELVRATRAGGPIDLADLEPGDHLLGWQGAAIPPRYCHHAREDEVDDLARSVGGLAREISRFSADGPSGGLNRYLLLERA